MISIKTFLIIIGAFIVFIGFSVVATILIVKRIQRFFYERHTPDIKKGLARVQQGPIEHEEASVLVRESDFCFTYEREVTINGRKVLINDFVPKTHKIHEGGKDREIPGVQEKFFDGRRVYYVDAGNCVAYGTIPLEVPKDTGIFKNIDKWLGVSKPPEVEPTAIAYYVGHYAPTGTKSEFPPESLSIEKMESTAVELSASVNDDKNALPWKWIVVIVAILGAVAIVALALIFRQPQQIIVGPDTGPAPTTSPAPVDPGPIVIQGN